MVARKQIGDMIWTTGGITLHDYVRDKVSLELRLVLERSLWHSIDLSMRTAVCENIEGKTYN